MIDSVTQILCKIIKFINNNTLHSQIIVFSPADRQSPAKPMTFFIKSHHSNFPKYAMQVISSKHRKHAKSKRYNMIYYIYSVITGSSAMHYKSRWCKFPTGDFQT